MKLRYVEVRAASEPGELTLDLARHLHCRLLTGRVVILVDSPAVFAPTLGRRWAKVLREIERERSSTLIPSRRRQLERHLATLKAQQFTIRPPSKPLAHIFVLQPSGFSSLPEGCATIYATTPITRERFVGLLRMLPEAGLLVTYDIWSDEYQAAVDEVIAEMDRLEAL